jgi:hypothetical protein
LHEPNLNLLNLEREEIELKVGDIVARKVFAILGNRTKKLASKLSSSSSGPYVVTEVGESILTLRKVGSNDAQFTAPSRHCVKWPSNNGAVVIAHPTYDVMKSLFSGINSSSS